MINSKWTVLSAFSIHTLIKVQVLGHRHLNMWMEVAGDQTTDRLDEPHPSQSYAHSVCAESLQASFIVTLILAKWFSVSDSEELLKSFLFLNYFMSFLIINH